MSRLLFVLSTVLALASGFKRPPIKLLDSRIIGGINAEITDFPYQISMRLQSGTSYEHICGGSIYSERVIVTAAHCLTGRSPTELRIVAGITTLNDIAALLEIDALIINSNYSSYTIDNDVGLIILAQPLVFSSTVQPIQLVRDNPTAGAKAVVTGWGSTEETGSTSNILQEVTIQIVDNDSCSKSYGVLSITNQMICAGVEEGGKDACQGDSGGPMVVDGQLAGIVSWGYGCARRDYPGVFSSVASLRSWIETHADRYLESNQE